MKDVTGTVTEIVSLVKYSPKREKLLGNIKDLFHFESLHTDDEIEVAPTLGKLSATRWTVRENANKKIESNYLLLMKLWDVLLATGKLDSEVKARIIGVQNQMCEFQFFYGLNLSQRLFAISDHLSKPCKKNQCLDYVAFILLNLLLRLIRKCDQMKKLNYFSNRLKETS